MENTLPKSVKIYRWTAKVFLSNGVIVYQKIYLRNLKQTIQNCRKTDTLTPIYPIDTWIIKHLKEVIAEKFGDVEISKIQIKGLDKTTMGENNE